MKIYNHYTKKEIQKIIDEHKNVIFYNKTSKKPKVSILLPCRNEKDAISYCIESILNTIKSSNISFELIISDSSTDGSDGIANQFLMTNYFSKLPVKLIKHDLEGYGNAYLEAVKYASGEYLIMVDADATYDFSQILDFIKYIDKGYDFVIGNRFAGHIEKGSMPYLHKYWGNPLLSFLISLFFGKRIKDAQCGMRAIRKDAFEKLELKTTGMEFASEMVIKAILNDFKIKQIPVSYKKRKGTSKLKSWTDGWRHLRFMLMFAPDYLFFVPGMFFIIIGFLLSVSFLFGSLSLYGITFYNSPMLLGCFLMILGYQIILTGLYAKTYMKSFGFIKKDNIVSFIAKHVTFERGILIGGLFFLMGFIFGLYVIYNWIISGFPAILSNILIFILGLLVISIQTVFSSWFLSLMLVDKK